MKQSICSAQIDKCTKVCYVLYHALYGITNVDSLEQLFLHLSLLSNHQLLSVTDHSSSLRIEFSNYELDLLTSVFGQILLVSIRYQTCRNKYSGLVYQNA